MERVEAREFSGNRLDRPGDWAVCFAASWCPFCAAFVPLFATLDGVGPLRIALADLSDLESPLWDRFEIETVPTVLVFSNGKVVWRRDGVPGQGLDLATVRAVRDLGSKGPPENEKEPMDRPHPGR